MARMEKVFTTIGSPGFPRDLEEIRALARESFERDHDPRGPGRQLAAIIASGDRTQELHRIHAPTLVIHGSADRLVGPVGRPGHRACDPGRLADDGQGHGPRPAACDLAAPDRRDRPARAAAPTPALRASHPYRPPRRFRACRSGVPPRSLPWAPLAPPAASAQAGLGVSAPTRADDAARLHLHQPVKVMATMRAAVGPTSVQDPQHPLCLACGRSHRAAAFIPLPVRRSSPPRRSTFTRSRLLLDLAASSRSFHPSLLQRRRSSGRAAGPARPDRDMKATPRRNVNGIGHGSQLCLIPSPPSTASTAIDEPPTGAPRGCRWDVCPCGPECPPASYS